MSKTEKTVCIEKALYKFSKANGLGVYGCFETSLGKAYGDERVDYMTMNSNDEFRCYEIKISKSDFLSKAKLSFCGDFNYLVIPESLLPEIKDLLQYLSLLWRGVGVLVYSPGTSPEIAIEVKPKRKKLSLSDRVNLMHCMVRSLSRYCKTYFQEENRKITQEDIDEIKTAVQYGCNMGYGVDHTQPVCDQEEEIAEEYVRNIYLPEHKTERREKC